MEQRGHLVRIFTGYPRFKARELPSPKTSTFPWLMTPYMALGRIGAPHAAERLSYQVLATFDRWMAARLPPCEVFHCMSGAGLESGRLARERHGTIVVCDRASSHMSFQQEILRSEFDRCGIEFRVADPRIVDRELAEYESADLIVVPSNFARRSFIRQAVPAEKIRVAPFGVNLQRFRPGVVHDEVFRVLFVGQIGVRKGIPYLLEALGDLRLPRFELCLAGTILPEIEPFLARHEGEFRYLGRIAHDRLHQIYAQASVLVLPSVEEGMAYVQAEAMACGVPVIGTPNSGAEDLFDDGVEGFIVPIRDPAAIRDRVLALYERLELHTEMSRAALRRVRALAGWDDYGAQIERLYLSALERPGYSHDASPTV